MHRLLVWLCRPRRIRTMLAGLTLITLTAQAADSSVLLLRPSQASEAINAAERIFANDLQGNPSHGTLQRQILTISGLSDERKQAYENADLIVTFGAKATEALLTITRKPKLLVMFARRAELEPLLLRYPGRVSGVYLNQPYRRALAVARAIKPETPIGSLLGPTTAPWITQALQCSANEQAAELRLLRTRIGDSPVRVFERLLDEVGVVIAIADPTIFNAGNLQSLLLAAYQRGIPVVGYSQAMVDAGAVAAVHTDPVLLGRQAATLAQRILSEPVLPVPEYPRDYTLAINYQAARTLKLAPLSEALLRAAITKADATERTTSPQP